MAQINSELWQGVRGKIGGFVVYQYCGKTCIRRLPNKESIKLSPEMLAQQERVAGIAALHQAMKAVGLQRIWKQAAKGKGMSGYAFLVKSNSQAFSGKGNVCDFSKLMFTDGDLQLPDHLTLQMGTNGELLFKWENDGIPYPLCHEDDRLVIGLVKQEKGISIKIPEIGDWRRKDGRAVIHIPEECKGFPHLYCYFCSAIGTQVSKSRYFLISKNQSYEE